MINSGATTNTPTAEVVGPNWAVNTVPSFATQVQRAVGGQLINGQPVTQFRSARPSSLPDSYRAAILGHEQLEQPAIHYHGQQLLR